MIYNAKITHVQLCNISKKSTQKQSTETYENKSNTNSRNNILS